MQAGLLIVGIANGLTIMTLGLYEPEQVGAQARHTGNIHACTRAVFALLL